MLIKVRQEGGRLIRCETDTGVISILDPRAMTMSYSKKLMQALCKFPRVYTVREIGEFIRSVKTDEYFEQ